MCVDSVTAAPGHPRQRGTITVILSARNFVLVGKKRHTTHNCYALYVQMQRFIYSSKILVYDFQNVQYTSV